MNLARPVSAHELGFGFRPVSAHELGFGFRPVNVHELGFTRCSFSRLWPFCKTEALLIQVGWKK